MAILMALAAQNTEVVGLTTVGGNVSLARGTRNALALLQAAGRSGLPVSRGASRPLRGGYRPSVAFHGPGGLSLRLPDPANGVSGLSAVEFIGEQLDRHRGEITLVALGPLTNLARLERRYPGRLSRARSIVVMGGAVETPGNVTPKAEFNFHSDPLAAREVLASGVPLTLVDLGACRQVWVDGVQACGLGSDNPLGQLAARFIQNWFRRDAARQRFEFYDPLALAIALDSNVASSTPAEVEVGTSEDEHWGETVVMARPGPVSVASAVNVERFNDVLRKTLGWCS